MSGEDISQGIRVDGAFKPRNIIFKSLETPLCESCETVTRDVLTVEDVTLEGFSLSLVRSVSFAPTCGFAASVEITAEVRFEDDAARTKLKTLAEVGKWIERNKVRIANAFGMARMASGIISSTSVQMGFLAFITSPCVQSIEN